MHQDATPSLDEVTFNACPGSLPVPVVTMVAPGQAHRTLYFSTGNCLHAISGRDGTAYWRQQVTLAREQLIREQLTRAAGEHPMMSYPPPPRAVFASPRVVDGMVYVCVYNAGAYTCALNADDGSLRWRTPTDARIISMPFLDFAVPLVTDHMVYSGSYALNKQDGTVLWRIAIDTDAEGTLALHALLDETIYATTHMGIYAINAQNAQIRWLSHPDDQCIVSGPPVVADRLLYAGTGGSVSHPDKSYFVALDVETGAEVWRYPMGQYIGAVVLHEHIYVSSGDGCIYALNTKSGAVRWQRQFTSSGYFSASIADNIRYLNINTEGAYALRSEDGAVLWHERLDSNSSVTFTPPLVLDGVVYLARIDGRGQSVLYALNSDTGFAYWHIPYLSAIASLTGV